MGNLRLENDWVAVQATKAYEVSRYLDTFNIRAKQNRQPATILRQVAHFVADGH
jgi:hypothetical protein